MGQGHRKPLCPVRSSTARNFEDPDGSHLHPPEQDTALQRSGFRVDGEPDRKVFSSKLPTLGEASTSRPSKRLKLTDSGTADTAEILDFVQKAKHGRVKTTLSESKTLLKDVLREVGTSPVALGLLAFAASHIQDRVERMSKNEEDILYILEKVGMLGRSLLQANLRDKDEQLEDDLILILVGVIWCEQRLQKGPLSRFGTVNITVEHIEDMNKRVEELRGNLHFAVSTEGLQTVRSLRELATMPLQAYKPPFPAHAVGLRESLDEVLELLRVRDGNAEGGVRAILLHGIGGIGKTTLATAVCSKIRSAERHFAKVELAEKPKICKLQMNLLERLSGESRRIGEFQEGQMFLKEHFASQQHIPFLLFIDNIFDSRDLRMLLPDTLDSLPDGSRVILMSRNRQAIDGIDNISKTVYSLGILNHTHARELFDECIKSFPHEKEEEIKRIVSLCGGLPLAIELVGTYLRKCAEKGSARVWAKVRADLEKCQLYAGGKEDALDKILSWSFDSVSAEAKRLFLDMCCYCVGNCDDYLVWEWVECLETGTELQELEDHALVKKVDFGDAVDMLFGYRLVIHDIVVLFGTKKSLHNTRILIRDCKPLEAFLLDNSRGLQSIHQATEVLRIVLEPWNNGFSLALSARVLDAMHKSLRVLELNPACVEGACKEIPSNLQVLAMNGGLEGCPFPYLYMDMSSFTQLRLLSLYNCRVPCISDIQLPGNLQICFLGKLEELQVFRPDAFAKCISSLHTLMIHNCNNLEALPLCLSCGPHSDKSIALRTLYIFRCESLKALPGCMSGFQSLERLMIWKCPQVRELPMDLGSLSALMLLRFVDCGPLENLLKSFGNLRALKYLNLENLGSFVELPEHFGNLSALTKLSLRKCSKLKELPHGFGKLLLLEELVLEDCQGLDTLPESVRQLKNLTKLDIRGCPKLQQSQIVDELRSSGRVEVLGHGLQGARVTMRENNYSSQRLSILRAMVEDVT